MLVMIIVLTAAIVFHVCFYIYIKKIISSK